MTFKNSLKFLFGKKDFSPSRAAASLLARLPKPAQRASEPAHARRPTSRAGLLTPSRAALASAQPHADRGRELPPHGDHVPASLAARQPRPDPTPTHPPTPAGACALAHSRPRCLPSPPEPRAPSFALAAPAAPPALSSRTTAPFPDSSRPQFRLALLQVALELAPPSEHRLSFPAPSHRRPWRRRARPPWKSSSFSSPASPSYPTALAFSSHIPCARQLSLPWPEMAAGLVAEQRRHASAHTGEASASASQPGRPGRAAMGRSPARPPRSPFARTARARSGHGPAVPHGPAQYCLNELFSFILYYLKSEMDFSPLRAAASLLARLPKPAQHASEPAHVRRPTSRAGLLTPSHAALASAQPRAVPLLAARPRADRGRELPPRGDHVPASPAARQPRPDPVPMHPPTPAGARALAHSRPRCLPSPPEPRAPSSALAAPAAPSASSSCTTAPFPGSSHPQFRLTLLQVVLELAPPSEHRLSFPAPSHRRPWRRHARPPWKSSSFSSPASPSYPTALAFSSHIPCARQLSLPWPEMAAGLVAELRRRASAHTGEASTSASQPGRPGRVAVGQSPARSGHGPAVPHGPAQYCLNELFSFILYYLKSEMV
ncbi:uncharacterized protein [Miscanthus floridulus]|uniref:uncharacterized protein n=1 Tax=Miscanthus floridulus TaxID=154761 RepID=UPI0034588719